MQLTASAFSAPITFARGRNGDVYGVTGQERGFRWDTVTAQVEQLGLSAPAAPPTVSASTSSAKYYLAGIDVTDGGFGYDIEPTVRIGGGGSSTLSFTAAFATGLFTANAHGMANGTAVTFTALTGGAGLSLFLTYYVIDTAANTFKLSLSKGGSAVTFTSDVSAGTLRRPVGNPGVAKANIIAGRVASVTLQEYGWGYTTAPTVTCSPPTRAVNRGTGARVEAIVDGYVEEVYPTDPGQDYTVPPDCTIGETTFRGIIGISNSSPALITHSLGTYLKVGDQVEFSTDGTLPTGLAEQTSYYVVEVEELLVTPAVGADTPTFRVKVSATLGGAPIGTSSAGSGNHSVRRVIPAPAVCYLDSSQKSTGILLASPSGGYSTGPSVTVSGGDGTGAAAAARMRYRVVGVRILASGSGYYGRPRIVFSGGDGGGAVAEAIVNEDGGIVGARLIHGGNYRTPPTCSIVADWKEDPRVASLLPVMRPAIQGKYWCALRYVDDTTEANRGPIPSSISDLAELELADNHGSISWGIPTGSLEARVHKIELWRTTADQALVLYKVAEVLKSTAVAGAVAGVYTHSDTMSDAELADPSRAGFDALPITLPNGQPNARRFNPPPQNKQVIAVFQDRAWYAVDVPSRTWSGAAAPEGYAPEPNSLYFSEADEPESVPETNEIVIQENVKGQDRVTALMPFGGGMVVFQERHCYRLTFVSQPLIDANVTLIGQRGCLNQRCWDTFDNVAYVVDAMGMYMLDGANAVPLSDPVETYWSDNIIHFASSKWFFVRVDPVTRIVRFFHSVSAGKPDRALCFHPLTKAWWVETYAQTFTAMECMTTGGRQSLIAGGETGAFYKFDAGSQDINTSGASTGIPCSIRTGNMTLVTENGSRSIRTLYKPTTADCTLSLALHYNNSATPRSAAVRTDRGAGFTTDGGASATLNLKTSRSALGDATGYAVCSYAGRVEDRSAGADRHMAVALSLTRPGGESAVLYGMAVEGVST